MILMLMIIQGGSKNEHVGGRWQEMVQVGWLAGLACVDMGTSYLTRPSMPASNIIF